MTTAMRNSLAVAALLAGLFFAAATSSLAQEAQNLSLGGGSLTDAIAQKNGLFKKHGLNITIHPARASSDVSAAVMSGAIEIANYGVDNAVALVEKERADVIIVMGDNSTPNHIVAQDDIADLRALRGTVLLVDAPDTQNALQLRKILSSLGLGAADYQMREAGGTPTRVARLKQDRGAAATMSSLQFFVEQRGNGLKSLGITSELIGPLAFYGGYARRTWVEQNREKLRRYIAAHIETKRWMMEPANEQAMVASIAESTRLSPTLAAELYRENMTRHGWSRDAAFDTEGFRNVLRLRAEVEGTWGGVVPAVDRYVDNRYYEEARASLGR